MRPQAKIIFRSEGLCWCKPARGSGRRGGAAHVSGQTLASMLPEMNKISPALACPANPSSVADDDVESCAPSLNRSACPAHVSSPRRRFISARERNVRFSSPVEYTAGELLPQAARAWWRGLHSSGPGTFILFRLTKGNSLLRGNQAIAVNRRPRTAGWRKARRPKNGWESPW